jgi:Glyoxalase/Bleomycin resistance protein/Dioxygenase superfamily
MLHGQVALYEELLGWPGCGFGAGARPISYAGAVHLGLIAIVVREYDPAISFFVDVLGFELVADSPARTNDGRPKRWVVVRPPGCRDRPAARAG